MKIQVKRFYQNDKLTLGLCSIDGVAECFIVEDIFRAVKVAGETRIPAGEYSVIWQKVNTPMSEKYRQKYDWFRHHLMLVGVKNYENVYIHVGNDQDDTEGCLLVNGACSLYDATASDSGRAFKKFYQKVGSAIDAGLDVKIKIEDENNG